MGLFSTVYHTHSHSERVVPYEKTVIEKKAPTDESIKIFDDILERTKDRVLGVFKVESTLVDCIVLAMANPNFCTVDITNIKYFVRFELNGCPKEFCFDLDAFEMNRFSSPTQADKKLLEKIIDKISGYIADEILRNSNIKTTKLGFSQNYKL